ncbi:uncharacterized protein L969DRAFT_85062 [Mixia osmundae IAM 14324]|uniref:RING-type domain-containing protein n=1 Tax=Mixia osmundae (strain CBS 9802 / IAM 14324 / JCM 22182 / KY 12970) TaxID=764103 RepID=G7DXA8_MIXOS|nr:uncharacterized protein L969DRAFT_85062 [Mixia osmundae IAM 14324]KEI41288.1 hypothetical protein L969DRAFT_85062 [Mixia osmundae IAM 14324]GAA95218.1 hypothetical protein E5Q_01874 [Mixia osmundae IAM 14324]
MEPLRDANASAVGSFINMLWSGWHKTGSAQLENKIVNETVSEAIVQLNSTVKTVLPETTSTRREAMRRLSYIVNTLPDSDQPQPLTFLKSAYFPVVMLMAIIISQIRHIVPSSHRRRLHQLNTRRYKFITNGLRALSLLGLAWAMRGIVLLWTQHDAEQTTRLARAMRMICGLPKQPIRESSALWRVFIATNGSALVENFVRSLENDDYRGSFNLLSFSYLLFFHGYTSGDDPDQRPTVPPTPPVFLLILLTLGEFACLTLMKMARKRWRLYITALFSLAGQATLLSLVIKLVYFGHPDHYRSATALLSAGQYVNRFSETIFLLIGIITVAIHLATHFVLEDRIPWRQVLHHQTIDPNDDFYITILRFGIHSLETTAILGWQNEVSSLNLRPYAYVELSNDIDSVGFDRVTGQVAMTYADPADPLHAARWPEDLMRDNIGFLPPIDVPRGSGLANEVKRVQASKRRSEWDHEDAPMHVSIRYCCALVLSCTATLRIINRKIGRLLRLGNLAGRADRLGVILRRAGVIPIGPEFQALAGAPRGPNEDSNDSDDEDFVPSDGSSDLTDDGEPDSEPEDHDRAIGPLALYNDLLAESSGDAAELAPVIVAHMTAASQTPLTRRRYARLSHRPDTSVTASDAALSTAIAARRTNMATSMRPGRTDPEDFDELRQKLCVICVTEARSIVCWPCRCFALCDDCRENMAGRYKASEHLCPCCRTRVDGYSRIYMP